MKQGLNLSLKCNQAKLDYISKRGYTWQNFQDVGNWTASNGTMVQEATGISHVSSTTDVSVIAKLVTADLTGFATVTLETEIFKPAFISSIVVRFKTDNSNYYSFTYDTGTNSTISLGFNKVTMDLSKGVLTDPGSLFSWGSITKIEIRVTGQTTAPRVVLRNLILNQVNRKIAVIESDDFFDGIYDTYKAYHDARGIKISLGLETDSINDANKLTDAELQELYALGYDFTGQCHSATANYESLTAAQVRTDMDSQLTTLKTSLGITNTPTAIQKVFTYNYGSGENTNDGVSIKQILKTEYGILHAAGDTSQPNGCIGLQSHENRNYMEIRGYSLTGETYEVAAPHLSANLQAYVDAGVANRTLMFFMFHAEGASAIDTDMYQALLDYLQTNQVEIMTRWQYVSNLSILNRGGIKTKSGHTLVSKLGQDIMQR